MTNTVTVSKAQKHLPKLLKSNDVVTVMRRDEVAAFIVPKDRFEALLETLETLANPVSMKAIRKFEAGRMEFHESLDKAWKELDK